MIFFNVDLTKLHTKLNKIIVEDKINVMHFRNQVSSNRDCKNKGKNKGFTGKLKI